MSAIDQYKHLHIGFIHCPSNEDFVVNNPTRKIAVYELREDIPADEKDFDGKVGDILLGGGSGEAPAFRVSVPEALYFFTKEDENDPGHDGLFKAFWTKSEAAVFAEGYVKLGCDATIPLEFWLAKNLCLLLINNVDQYAGFKTSSILKSEFETHFTKL